MTVSGNNSADVVSALQNALLSAPQAAPVAAQGGIDQIAVKMAGGYNFIGPAEWTALATDQKKSLIQDGAVTFLSGGEQVELKEALTRLKAQQG